MKPAVAGACTEAHPTTPVTPLGTATTTPSGYRIQAYRDQAGALWKLATYGALRTWRRLETKETL